MPVVSRGIGMWPLIGKVCDDFLQEEEGEGDAMDDGAEKDGLTMEYIESLRVSMSCVYDDACPAYVYDCG